MVRAVGNAERCLAEWGTSRWPFFQRCVHKAKVTHVHSDDRDVPPPHGLYYTTVGEERRNFQQLILNKGTTNQKVVDEEILPLGMRLHNGHLSVVCTRPHYIDGERCTRRWPISDSLDEAIAHAQGK